MVPEKCGTSALRPPFGRYPLIQHNPSASCKQYSLGWQVLTFEQFHVAWGRNTSMDIDFERRCPQGHAMSEEARYCPACGMVVADLATGSAAESPSAATASDLPMTAPVITPQEPQEAPSQHDRSRLWWGIAALAIALLLSATAAFWFAIGAPQYQQQQLTTALRDQGLASQFSSDAAAVAHAQSVCRNLDNGGAQHGPKEDVIAVSIYSKYESGFTTLSPIEVEGSFTLNDSDPLTYSPSITADSNSCQGAGGYSDISPGTEVLVENGSGTVLTTTNLGVGTGSPPTECEFTFSFTVMDGSESGYSVTISHRGELHYTAAQLKIPNEVASTMGN